MTAMKMHPYYTEIPLRSFDAMAFEGNISELLLALIVDPLEADDVARSIHDIHDTKIELISNEDGKSIVEAPILLEDFKSLGLKAFESMKISIAQWMMSRNDATAINFIGKWNRRLGIWCACSVSRHALQYLRVQDERPLSAIKVAERWVIEGTVPLWRIRKAADDAFDCMAEVSYAPSRAAALTAVSIILDNNVAEPIVSAAEAKADFDLGAVTGAGVVGSVLWRNARDAELIRLREVVANACLTFPG